MVGLSKHIDSENSERIVEVYKTMLKANEHFLNHESFNVLDENTKKRIYNINKELRDRITNISKKHA